MADRCNEVLLLEDQALIALDVEELLEQVGFTAIHICSLCSEAADWLEKHTPVLAVIETRLRDGQADEIAAVLAARGIPYIVHSRQRDRPDQHPLMNTRRRWITKPCDPQDFIDAVRECHSKPPAVRGRRTASRNRGSLAP